MNACVQKNVIGHPWIVKVGIIMRIGVFGYCLCFFAALSLGTKKKFALKIIFWKAQKRRIKRHCAM